MRERESTRAWEQRGEARKGRERQAVIMAGSAPAFCWNSVPQVVTAGLPCALSHSAYSETSLRVPDYTPRYSCPYLPHPYPHHQGAPLLPPTGSQGPCSAGLRAGHPAGVQGSYNHWAHSPLPSSSQGWGRVFL